MSTPPHSSLRSYAPPAWRARIVLVFGLLLAGLCASAHAAPPVSREYQIKAAFLYNFTKFIEWPPERFSDARSPLVIGVLGDNPFGDELANAVKDRTAHGRAIATLQVRSLEDASSVHLLFIATGEERLLSPAVLESLNRAGIVTIGESIRFSDLGGIITFTTEAGKVRFEINRAAAADGQLKFSAQLLKLAAPSRRTP